jgi:hypothetical protein
MFILFPYKEEYNKNISSNLILMLFILNYIPILSLLWLSNMSIVYSIYLTISYLIMFLVINKRRKSSITNKYFGLDFYKTVFLTYILISIYLIIQRGGVDIRSFSFQDIYELRSEQKLGILDGYLVNWVSKVFTPFFIAYGLYKKKKYIYITAIIVQVMLYLSFGFKAFLISIIFALLVYFVTKKSNDFKMVFVKILTILIVTSSIFYLFNIFIFRDVLIYRTIFIPAQIQYNYFDFFQNNEFLYYSEGLIGRLFGIEYSYNQPIGFIVDAYTHSLQVGSNANTGIFSYEYANSGFLGMVIIAIVFGFLLNFLDLIGNRYDSSLTMVALSYYAISLNDTNFFINLLTGGLVILVFLLVFAKPKGKED